MAEEPAYHTWREFLTPEDIQRMDERKAERIARGKPPELPWRQIVERLFGRLMDWETDYEPEPFHRCVTDMYTVFEEYEEAWQDLGEWELREEHAEKNPMRLRFDRDPNVIWINDAVRIGLEFKLPDMWVGAFWKTNEEQAGYYRYTDIWICLVPTIPLHIIWHRRNRSGRRLQ